MNDSTDMAVPVGILALQGAYASHRRMFKKLGMKTRLVRYPEDFDGIGGIVAPGGESTTMIKLLEQNGLTARLKDFVTAGNPYFGTCAGAIIASMHVANPEQESFGFIDVDIKRNAYGRQVDSFVADIALPGLGIDVFHGVFIRAPVFTRLGEGIEVLAEYGGSPVLIRKGKILLATFHPELSDSPAVHEYFVKK